MKKREAQFGVAFRHWLRDNPLDSAMFELKQTTGRSLPFDAVKQHQIDWLRAGKSVYGALWKPPDFIGVQLPCDYFYVRNGDGWVVVKFPGGFYVIDVDRFVAFKERAVACGRKSMTEPMAEYISTYHERY